MKLAARKWVDYWWDLRLGVKTRGTAPVSHDDAVHYATLPYPHIFRILGSLQMGRDDVFVDIGCGKGRVVCCCLRLPIKKVIGVENDGYLLSVARSNVTQVRGARARALIFESAAEDYAYLEGTVFYLFHPFGALTLSKVLSRLRRARDSHPRPLRIVYANDRHKELLENAGWLEVYDRWTPVGRRALDHAVSFWTTTRRAKPA
ncbi:MAG: class I SAM-dependent methyltransferase [Acidobacteriota bacterium]